MKKSSYMNSASSRALLGPMSAVERAMGRYMRDESGHGDGSGGGGGGSGGGGAAITIDNLPDALDDINLVPAKLRGLYVQKDGKYVYNDPAALRGAYERVEGKRNTFKTAAERANILDELGMTPEELEELETARDTAALDKAKAEGDFSSLKQQMEDNHKKAIDSLEAREAELLKALEGSLVDADVQRALSEPGLEGNPTLLLPHLRGRVKVVETDEGFERQVLLPDGKTPMLNAESKPATLKDLLTEFKTKSEFAAAFKGDNQSGGGASNGGSGGGAPGSLKRSEMSVPDRVAFIAKNGQDKYLALPA